MTEEEKQKRLRYVVIGLGVVAIVLVVVLIMPTLRGGGVSTPTKPSPLALGEAHPETAAGSTAPSTAGAAGGQAPSPTAVGAALTAGAAGAPAGAGGAEATPAVPPEDPNQLLATTTDAAVTVTVRRMFGQTPSGKQVVVSPRVRVEPPKPKIPFYDPSAGYGWGVVARGSQAAGTR